MDGVPVCVPERVADTVTAALPVPVNV